VTRRGVSEIIASLLVLMIVSVLGTVLYSYSLNISQLQQDRLIRETTLSTEKAQERFLILGVWYRQSNNIMNLTVLNYGKHELFVSDVYVNGVRVSNQITGFDSKILTEDIGQVIFQPPSALGSGVQHEIEVVSVKGVTLLHLWGY
jgi:flagellin-like protein